MSKATHAIYTQRRGAENAEDVEKYNFGSICADGLATIGGLPGLGAVGFIVVASI
jgi:hypothetical protein